MAFKQTLVQRMFNICNNKFSNQSLRSCRIAPSSAAAQALMPSRVPDRPPLAEALRSRREGLMQRLREMDLTRGRICLDGIVPPVRRPAEAGLTVADAKKLLRVSQIEVVKSNLRSSGRNHVAYDEFVEMCVEGCSSRDLGLDLAKVLDDSGSVIVLGNVVFLNPEQVVKAIRGLIPTNPRAPHDPPLKELEEMERWKSAIDAKAKKMVRRELWGGLAYLMVQTAAFMRLTFWELSWDVMEPICFYVTSMYFMGGYAFFLRTSREPSFEGFFHSRFNAKQKKLMKIQGFDVEKYDKLKRACNLPHHQQQQQQPPWPREGLSLGEVSKGAVNKSFT